MRYDAVLFDLDGTLFDTSPGIHKTVERTLADYGMPAPSPAQLRLFVGPPLHQGFHQAFGLPQALADEMADHYISLYPTVGMALCEVYPGLAELINRLRGSGVTTGVATLKNHRNLHSFLESGNFPFAFDILQGSDPASGCTVKSEIVERCVALTQVADRSRVLMVGDSGYDALGAKSCGVKFAAVTYGFGFLSREEASRYPNDVICDSAPALEVHIFRQG